MCVLRVAAAPVQPALPDLDLLEGMSGEPIEWWWGLPEVTREGISALLARLIVRCVLAEDAGDGGEGSDG